MLFVDSGGGFMGEGVGVGAVALFGVWRTSVRSVFIVGRASPKSSTTCRGYGDDKLVTGYRCVQQFSVQEKPVSPNVIY